MAKGRSDRRSRDDNYIANPRVDFLEAPLRPSWLSKPVLDPIHDLRVYHPATQLLGPLEVSPSIPGRSFQARVGYAEVRPALPSHRTNRMGDVVRINNRQRAIPVFQAPKNVPVCVRRSTRREVLFAKGKGGRGYRRPRWKERSYMRCK